MAKYEEWKLQEQQKRKFEKKPEPKERSPGKAQKRKATEAPPPKPQKFAKIDEDGFKVPQPISRAPKEPKEAPKPYKKGENEDRTVFVSNLEFTTSEQDIIEFAGELKVAIESVDLVKDKAEKSRGFGFVLMSSKETAELLMKKDREMWKGRPVFLSSYQTPEQRKPVFK